MTSYKTSNWVQKIYRDTDRWCASGITPLSTLPSTMCRYLTTKPNAEYDPDTDSEIPCYWATEERYTSHSTTMISRCCAKPSRMRLVVSGATIFKREMTVLESQPLPQTITVPDVQEWSTVRFIHKSRRLAANDNKCTESSDGRTSNISAITPEKKW